MPKILDDCLKSIQAGWKRDPSSRPKSEKDDESLAYAVCRARLKLEEQQAVQLEKGNGHGPALVAVAATIKPHLRQRGHEISLIEKDGKEFVKVPIARMGVYRHPKAPNGKLVFSKDFMEAMIANHNSRVTDYNVALDLRHKDNEGALAWLDTDDGGWLEMEGPWLNAYGVPTDEKAKDLIRSKRYRYASAEFYYNYKSNFMYKLSTDEMDEVDDGELIQEVDNMPKVLKLNDVEITLEGVKDAEDVFQLDKDSVTKVEDFVTDAAKQVADLNKKLTEAATKLETATTEATDLKNEVADLKTQVQKLSDGSDGDEDEDEVPEPVRVRLEALEKENTELNRQRMAEKVAFTLSKARDYTDKRGFGHDKMFLELAEAGLKFEGYEQGDVAVKLEDGETVQGAVKFYRNLIKVMLETVPGTVPRQSQTTGEDQRLPGTSDETFTEEELELELKAFHEEY